jgi:hypothetical protein
MRQAAAEAALQEDLVSVRKARATADPANPTAAILALALFMVDLTEEPVVSWKAARAVLREENLADHVARFDPLGRQRAAKFRRVERRLLAIPADPVKATSYAAYFVSEWLRTCTGARRAAGLFKARKLGLQEDAPPIKPIAPVPGETDQEDADDEEAEDEEDLGQVVQKILQTELEAEELEHEATTADATATTAPTKKEDPDGDAAEEEEEEEDDE